MAVSAANYICRSVEYLELSKQQNTNINKFKYSLQEFRDTTLH